MRRRRRLRPDHDAGLLDDARHLALEVSGLAPPAAVDVMALGVVLEPGEVPRRLIDVWSHFRQAGQWMNLVHCGCLVTDRRLLLRLPSAELASLWWSGVVGLDVDLPNGRVVLDYGDGRPRAVSGPGRSCCGGDGGGESLWFRGARDPSGDCPAAPARVCPTSVTAPPWSGPPRGSRCRPRTGRRAPAGGRSPVARP